MSKHPLARATVAALTLALAPLLAHAQPANATSRCLLTRNIAGFSAPNDRTVLVRVGVREIWELDLMNSCPGLSFRQGIGLKNSPGNPWICSPLEATVVYGSAGIRQYCQVRSLHRLTAGEIGGVAKRDRP